MLRVLVTGGAGFIGHALVARLKTLGANVVVADLKPSRHHDVHCVQGDLLDPAVVEASLTPGTDAVIHLAAFTSVLKSLDNPYFVYQTNLAMTAQLLERSRMLGVRRFLFASTNAVVGDVGTTPIDEHLPLDPLTPYGATKAAAEMMMATYTHAYGVAGCALRLTNVYGPGMQHKDSFIPRLMRAALGQAPVHIYGDGTQVRDYVFLDDVVQAFATLLTRPMTGPVVVGYGHSVSVNQLYQLACEVTGQPIAADHVPPKPGEMPAVVVRPDKLRALGLAPRISLPEGLKRVWEDFQRAAGS